MIIINQQDFEKAVEPYELINAIEKAYAIQYFDNTHIPDRMHIDNHGNTLLLMPGFTETIFGTKLVSLFPENSKLNKPVINGLMVLNDSKTGEPIAIINGSKLTAMRTGAVGATAIKHLAKASAQTLGIIGAGVQAFHQAMMAIEQRPFERLILCDSNIKKARELKQKLKNKLDKIDNINVTDNSNQLVLESDVIITATSSYKPVFDIDKNKLKDKTFIGIGSYKPDMQEFPLSLFEVLNKVYVDTLLVKQESGDIKIPLEKGLIKDSDVISFGNLLESKNQNNKSSTNLFKSVGLALFDITVAELIYNNAKEKGLGIEVEL